jgi:hypothetical protein
MDNRTVTHWRPPWQKRAAADLALVAQSTVAGCRFDVAVGAQADAAVFHWLIDWLHNYERDLAPGDRGEDVTFFYLLAGYPLGDPNGAVGSSSGCIEFGFGSEHHGPPDGEAVALQELLRTALRTLGD